MANQSKPGKARWNGFWKHVISEICIGFDGEPMEFEWEFSQDSQLWEFSTTIRKKLEPEQLKGRTHLHVNVQWHCLGETRKQKNVLRMLLELLSMLEDSCKDIGRFKGLDPRRNGTAPMSTNRMEKAIKLLKAWCSTLPKADILHPVLPAH